MFALEIYCFNNFAVQKLVSMAEVTNTRTYSRKTNMLRNINTIGRVARDIATKKWGINYFKIIIIPFIINFR